MIPVVEQIMRTGYPKRQYQPKSPKKTYSSTACDVCNKFEAEIKFRNTKLCSVCCSEENITIL